MKKIKNIICHAELSLLSISTLLIKQQGPEQKHLRTTHSVGFTLIELLVVVLIIGILSAIALPQYQKAVFKSRMAEAFINLKALKNAVEVCELENGRLTTENAETNQCGFMDNLNIQLGENDGNESSSQNFRYTLGHSESFVNTDDIAGSAAYQKQDVCICIHDDGHFSTPNEWNGCGPSDYPSFDVAKTLNIREDVDCQCC